jgi:hypothetical protein
MPWLRRLGRLLLAALRDLSGETALQARMARGCGCEREAVRAAWEDTHGGVHRCC